MKRIYCNDDWQFATVFSEALLRPDFDASSLETVRLPPYLRRNAAELL